MGDRTYNAIYQCARWLSYCVQIGWLKRDLDELEALWWKYHDHRGRLRSP